MSSSVKKTCLLLGTSLRETGQNFWLLVIPASLAAGASLFEGISLALLLPGIQVVLATSSGASVKTFQIPYWASSFLPQSNYGQLAFLVFAILLATLLKVSLGYYSSLLTAFQVKQFAHKLRNSLYTRYLSFGKQFFDKNSLGMQQQILTTYVSVISLTLTSFQMALYAAFTSAIYLSMMALISVPLTLIVLLIFPVLHISLKRLIEKIVHASHAYTIAYSELGKNIGSALSAVPLIKSYCNEKEELKKFSDLSSQVAAYEYSIEKKNQFVGPFQEFVLVCFVVILAGLIGLIESWGANGSIAEYLVFLLILKRAATLFGIFNTLRSSIASISGPFDQLMQIFQDSDKYYISDGDREFKELKNQIEIRNLKFSFQGETSALKNLSIKIEKGKLTGIVGASGAGKSTIVNLLMRFYDCEPGTIFIDGVDIRSYTLKSWRAKCALVSQDTYLFHADLRSNLIYGLNRDIDDSEIYSALEVSQLSEFVRKLPDGLRTQVGERGFQLSGGQRQRVAIARAVIKKADILFLDEAVSALDSLTEREVNRALEQVIIGKTSIIVAHRLASVRAADNIIVLEQGRAIESGSINELLKLNGRFAEYWSEQGMIRIGEK